MVNDLIVTWVGRIVLMGIGVFVLALVPTFLKHAVNKWIGLWIRIETFKEWQRHNREWLMLLRSGRVSRWLERFGW